MKSYAARRASLLKQMQQKGGGVAIIPTAPEVPRNRDSDFPYRHDSYFYYLSGFMEPEAVIVLVAGKTNRSILFCREKNLEREIWDGYRYGPEAARDTFGFDEAYPVAALSTLSIRLLFTTMELALILVLGVGGIGALGLIAAAFMLADRLSLAGLALGRL